MSLQIQNLSKSYPGPLRILNHLNLQMSTGESVAIVGQSGSGKSTFLSLLAGLDRPDHGLIQIDGQEVNLLNESEMTAFRGRKIGIIFQQFHLLPHLTAIENVMLPLEIQNRKEIFATAQDVLSSVGLSHRLSHLPAQMSGGECQRVAMARALVISPSLLLADEPSGSLDVETGQNIMDLFFKTIQEKKITTCLVTHSLELAAKCNRRFSLTKGSLVEIP